MCRVVSVSLVPVQNSRYLSLFTYELKFKTNSVIKWPSLQLLISEDPSSKLGFEIDSLDCGFHGCSKLLELNVVRKLKLRHSLCLPHCPLQHLTPRVLSYSERR
jgi:hypothetical protein